MSMPAIVIVDVNNKVIELTDLTQTALGSLIVECEGLLDELKDAEAAVED